MVQAPGMDENQGTKKLQKRFPLWQQNPQIKSVPKMQFIQAHLNWTILPPNSKKIQKTGEF
jgi:hypothetical protein